MNTSEYGVCDKLDEVGKEYISKCLGVIRVSDSFVKSMADNIFVIKSTLNLMKPDIENLGDKNSTKKIEAYSDVIKNKTTDMFRMDKSSKMKLRHISKLRFGSKIDYETRESHSSTYKKFNQKMFDTFDNYLRNVIDNIYELLKDVKKIVTNKERFNEISKWYATFFLLLKKAFNLLKICVSNSKVIKTHIDAYRDNLIKQVKTCQIMDEIKKVRLVELMQNDEKIKVGDITPGIMFGHTLFEEDSTIVKEPYVPFTEDDINELKKKEITHLCLHNNFDKNFMTDDYHVIVIDNDPTSSSLMELKIKEEQFKVTVYNDSEDALREIVVSLPDIVVLEVNMPNVNGFTFLKAMHHLKKEAVQKEIDFNIPIITTSTLSNERVIAECIRLGAVDYILKPLSSPLPIEDLLIKLKYHLSAKDWG